MEKQLKVTGVRYFETRRGLGYQCKTNIKGLEIWNDGNGGGTYFSSEDYKVINGRDIARYEEKYSETDLEYLIDVFEGVDLINKYI